MMLPAFERDQSDQIGGLRRARCVRIYGCHVRRGSERSSVCRGAAVRGRGLMGRGPAAGEAPGDHDLPRPKWDVIRGELVEFFRTRTDVSILLRLVSDHLDRLAVVSERPGKEPPSRAGVTSW